MNEYDSQKMLTLLAESYRPVASPEEAKLILVNTCSVREKAQSKLYSLLGRLREIKERDAELVIGVAGCVAQQEGRNITKRHPEVDFVVGTHNLSLIPSIVAQAGQGSRSQIVVDYREEWEELPDSCNGFPEIALQGNDGRSYVEQLEASRVRALVAIQRGCSKRCAFCVVPGTRGPQVSRSPEEILKELCFKVSLGAKEVLLLGQTVNSYGMDLSPRLRFEELILQIAEIEGLKRIRFSSPHPAEVKPDLIKLYGNLPQLCAHIHLPVQSGSNRILKLMRRSYRKERYLEIVAALRNVCPEIGISTDLIVGFPTETEEDFGETLDLMKEVRYNSAFSFKYSPRPHTDAISRFSAEQEIPEEVSQERLLRLQELQDKISQETHTAMLGTEVEVLVEGPAKAISSVRGRIPQNALIELTGGTPAVGSIVQALVEHASPHGLRGRLLGGGA